MGRVDVAISLDEEILAEARARAGERGLSAYVNAVLADHFQRLRILAYLREQAQECDPPSPDAHRAADHDMLDWLPGDG